MQEIKTDCKFYSLLLYFENRSIFAHFFYCSPLVPFAGEYQYRPSPGNPSFSNYYVRRRGSMSHEENRVQRQLEKAIQRAHLQTFNECSAQSSSSYFPQSPQPMSSSARHIDENVTAVSPRWSILWLRQWYVSPRGHEPAASALF